VLNLLAEELERTLLRLETGLPQTRQSLLARRMLLTRDNAPLLRLHKILAREAATCVLRLSVVHLRLGSYRGHLGASHLPIVVLARGVIRGLVRRVVRGLVRRVVRGLVRGLVRRVVRGLVRRVVRGLVRRVVRGLVPRVRVHL
jgi:hypothetical protein